MVYSHIHSALQALHMCKYECICDIYTLEPQNISIYKSVFILIQIFFVKVKHDNGPNISQTVN